MLLENYLRWNAVQDALTSLIESGLHATTNLSALDTVVTEANK